MEIATFIYVKAVKNEPDNRFEYNLVTLEGEDWAPSGTTMKYFGNSNPRRRMFNIAVKVFKKLGTSG